MCHTYWSQDEQLSVLFIETNGPLKSPAYLSKLDKILLDHWPYFCMCRNRYFRQPSLLYEGISKHLSKLSGFFPKFVDTLCRALVGRFFEILGRTFTKMLDPYASQKQWLYNLENNEIEGFSFFGKWTNNLFVNAVQSLWPFPVFEIIFKHWPADLIPNRLRAMSPASAHKN